MANKEDIGVTASELRYLIALCELAEEGGSVKITELAGRMGLPKSVSIAQPSG